MIITRKGLPTLQFDTNLQLFHTCQSADEFFRTAGSIIMFGSTQQDKTMAANSLLTHIYLNSYIVIQETSCSELKRIVQMVYVCLITLRDTQIIERLIFCIHL